MLTILNLVVLVLFLEHVNILVRVEWCGIMFNDVVKQLVIVVLLICGSVMVVYLL